MSVSRLCSKTACGRPAVATLTYVYRDSTCVVGPLAVYAEPHSYDLCAVHADRLTPPVGWDIVRLELDLGAVAEEADPRDDDLLAVVDAVREDPVRPAPRPVVRRPAPPEPPADPARRRHLRVLRDDDRADDR